MTVMSVPDWRRATAQLWRLCLERHGRHYLPFRTMSGSGMPAQYFRQMREVAHDIVLTPSISPMRGKDFIVECIIDCQVVLSRAPEGPIASHIGSFARSLSKQGYSLYSIHQRVCSLRVLVDGLNSWESDYAVSPPIIRRGICNIALGMHNQVRAMLPRLGTCSSFCALKASFPPRRSQHPD